LADCIDDWIHEALELKEANQEGSPAIHHLSLNNINRKNQSDIVRVKTLYNICMDKNNRINKTRLAHMYLYKHISETLESMA
jgi:hypothetical protein